MCLLFRLSEKHFVCPSIPSPPYACYISRPFSLLVRYSEEYKFYKSKWICNLFLSVVGVVRRYYVRQLY
jgi:hypothetical protein